MCVLMSLREVYINLLIEILVLLKSLLEHYSLSGLKKLRIKCKLVFDILRNNSFNWFEFATFIRYAIILFKYYTP